ncbi:TIGR00282 family metallophosphoesterase [Pontibacillus salicampi]|uniref:TIGR00282 family metallophosphoesterase n=1 Tax=Pontibacillus salicampi TaxID=1449801 RepID=A0ABV6LP67_9BACI
MRILFVGDIVGSPGRSMVEEYIPKLKRAYRPHFTIFNGENAASGKGITQKIYQQFLGLGAHAITLGNHAWDKKEIFDFIDDANRMVRPANYPEGTPGKGLTYIKENNMELAIINLQARTFMQPLEDPFRKADELIEEASKRTKSIFIDFHGEATSEKQALAWYVSGRVSAIVGTHTHVQTADDRILPGGTAYITDVGMTGPYDEILGTDKDAVIKKFLTNLPVRFEVPKSGRTQLSAFLVDVDEASGNATRVERILINDDHPFLG